MSISRVGRALPLLFGSALALPAAADFTAAFTTPEEAAQANERTVGVLLERDDRVFDLMADIEASLNLAAGLRIVPIVGKNHVQSVYDLLYLDGVDLALVRSDSIEYVRRVDGLVGAPRVTRNVARVGNEKIVVVAHEAYARPDELEGRPIAFGLPGSGEFVTGTLLFDTLGIDVRKVEAHGGEALERVRSGELAAMIHLLGAPGAFSGGDDASAGGVSVLPLPRDDGLSDLYHRTTLDAEDLPGLIAAGESVPTYSVDVNLVAYAWSSSNERTRRMTRFVEALVDRLAELQGNAFQPEWREVSLEPETPNIDSSPMVEQALARRAATMARLREAKDIAESGSEAETRAARPQLLMVKDGRVVAGLGGTFDGENGSEVERLLDELDTLLALPVGDEAPAGAAGEPDGTPDLPVPVIAEPYPGDPDG